MKVTLGDATTVPLTNLRDAAGNPAVFVDGDVLLFTAKKHIASPAAEALLTKSSVDGGISINIGTDNALLNIFTTDWTFALRHDLEFVWDIKFLPGGDASQRTTIATGTGTIEASVGSNPIVDPTAGFQTGVQACSPWATSSDVLGRFDYDGDPDMLDLAMRVASDVLFELTGRRWPGRCHDSIRPIAQFRTVEVPGWYASLAGLAQRGSWGYCSCNRIRETGCFRIPEIKLPGNPVAKSTIVVKINGDNFTDFALHDRRYLARTDGQGWPCCQDLLADDTHDNTWSVAYDFGMLPPPGGRVAATLYGYQLALAMDPEAVSSGKCLLPARVTTITRQGVTQVVLDPGTLAAEGQVGLSLVDQWVAATNIGRTRRPATVLIPGRIRSARRIS